MALSKKIVGLIVALMIISVTGLVILQVTLLESSKTLKEQTFRRNVSNALTAVAEEMETYEATVTALEVAGDSSLISTLEVSAKILHSDSNQPELQNIIVIADGRMEACSGLTVGAERSKIPDSLCHLDSIMIKDLSLNLPDISDREKNYPDNSKLIFKIKASSDTERVFFLQKVIDRLWNVKPDSIQTRINLARLDSVLEFNLMLAGIDLDYVYAIRAENQDTLWPEPSAYRAELASSEFRTRLFPHDFLTPPSELLLFFPQGDYYIWRQLGLMLILTAGFLLIIVISFVYTIKTIIAQRKNAALMVDFVNNMTHEFKTPISTVALASEAILRPDIISDNEKVTRFSKMIQDENGRMRRQTEKILQMATLEEGDFELNLVDLDLHQIIDESVKSINLQVESRGGEIKRLLKAEPHILRADRDHLFNIIFNLLDNAAKYSQARPDITISTWNGVNGIFISVEDKGRGIGQDDLKMVFKKYYRVPTGNTHDVKGFGLGLSYVKLMVDAHKGKISIKSSPGKGTYIEIFFPFLRAKIRR